MERICAAASVCSDGSRGPSNTDRRIGRPGLGRQAGQSARIHKEETLANAFGSKLSHLFPGLGHMKES
jgi:hypothetical protein